MSLNRKVLL